MIKIAGDKGIGEGQPGFLADLALGVAAVSYTHLDVYKRQVQAQSKATADAIEARLREIDWKDEAQKGAEGGLRWLSKRLEELAEKLRAGKQ